MSKKLCKKCKKVLPENYKQKYCEYCQGERAKTLRVIGSAALAVATAIPLVGKFLKKH